MTARNGQFLAMPHTYTINDPCIAIHSIYIQCRRNQCPLKINYCTDGKFLRGLAIFSWVVERHVNYNIIIEFCTCVSAHFSSLPNKGIRQPEYWFLRGSACVRPSLTSSSVLLSCSIYAVLFQMNTPNPHICTFGNRQCMQPL